MVLMAPAVGNLVKCGLNMLIMDLMDSAVLRNPIIYLVYDWIAFIEIIEK